MAERNQALTRELARHALAKPGATQSIAYSQMNPLLCPDIVLPGLSWGGYFSVRFEEWFGHAFTLPVLESRLKKIRKLHPAIKDAKWAPRDGHTYMYVPQDGLSASIIKQFIDEAHGLVWGKLTDDDKLQIQLGDLPYDEAKLMDRLMEMNELKDYRQAIRKLAKPAVLLRTKKSSEVKIPVGATKIGGRPDLPAVAAWPSLNDKPLAFLAQIDLAAIAKLGTFVKGLPATGLLSIFSAHAWEYDEDGNEHLPSQDFMEQPGWTVILHHAKSKLERRKPPRGARAFKAAAVTPTPLLSLPNHREEPALAKLNWSDDVLERFDRMQSAYRKLQMRHWLKLSDTFASHHLLGGYAMLQQCWPDEVTEKGLAMLLQIGSDAATEMSWGDGGELTVFADAKALGKGRFEKPWAISMGG